MASNVAAPNGAGRTDSEYLIREAMRKAAFAKAKAADGGTSNGASGGVPAIRRRRRAPEDYEKSEGLEQSGWTPLKLLARGSAEHGAVVHLCTANEKNQCESQAPAQAQSRTSVPVEADASISQGGGKATAASSPSPPSFVAVKVIPRWSLDERATQRLADEVKLLCAAGQDSAVLAHPNLVRYYGQSVDPDFHFLSLEALVGGPLHKHLRAGALGARGGVGVGSATFSCGRALYYTAQLEGAVRHMHVAGIVHRGSLLHRLTAQTCARRRSLEPKHS